MVGQKIKNFSATDKTNLEEAGREVEKIRISSQKLKENLEQKISETTRFNEQLAVENKQSEFEILQILKIFE